MLNIAPASLANGLVTGETALRFMALPGAAVLASPLPADRSVLGLVIHRCRCWYVRAAVEGGFNAFYYDSCQGDLLLATGSSDEVFAAIATHAERIAHLPPEAQHDPFVREQRRLIAEPPPVEPDPVVDAPAPEPVPVTQPELPLAAIEALQAAIGCIGTLTNRLLARATNRDRLLRNAQAVIQQAQAALQLESKVRDGAKALTPQLRICWATSDILNAEIHFADGSSVIVVTGDTADEINSKARRLADLLTRPDPLPTLRLCLHALDDVADATTMDWRSDALLSEPTFERARDAVAASLSLSSQSV